MRRLSSLTTPIRYNFLRGRGHHTLRQLTAVFAGFTLIATGYFATLPNASVSAAPSQTLTFQARILTAPGALVPDGNYNVQFNLYDVASGGTSLWTETYLNQVAGNDITIKNGYLYANLGTITSFPSTINWDQELWLTLNIGNTNVSCTPFSSCSPDGEMSPRFKITATPYAFKANSANNVNSNNTSTASTNSGNIQIQTGNATGSTSNSGNITIDSGTATGTAGTISLGSTNASALTLGRSGITTTNSGSFAVQGTSTLSGQVLAKNSSNSTNAFEIQDSGSTSYMLINTTSGQARFGANGTTSTTLQGGSGGIQISSGANVNIGVADTNGTLLVVDTKSDAGDPSGSNGAIYYNSSLQKFRCFENGAWIDCIGGAPYLGTTATLVGGVQNVLANQTAFPIENMVFTSTTAVSNTAASGGFTAPADGSFRSCLVQNTANVTAGTIGLRWRVNGVSVGAPVCSMNSTTNRQATSILNPGTVTFVAGDIIDVAFDTSAAFAPTGSNDFTVYWGVEYVAGSGGGGSGGPTLQDAYDQSLSASILTADNKDLTVVLGDTTTDSDFVVNVASGSTSRFVVQDNGTDTFSVNGAGDVTAARGITVGNSSSTTAGTIRWTGTDFEGYDGANWVSLTAGGGGGGSGQNFVSRVKQVNESVISSIALQDDNELTFPIGPNEEWSYRFVVQANAAAAADLRFAVSAPVGAVCNTATSEAENAASDAQVGCGATSAILNGNGTPELYEITGSVVNGATPGNVTLRWAQFTSNATNTIVYAGSYVQAVRSIGAGGNGQPFAQDGNAFGVTGVLGTTDANGLSIITDNTERLSISSTGAIEILGTTTLGSNLLASGTATGTTGTTTGTGTNTTTLTLTTDAFNVNDVIRIDNAGQDYYTRVTVDGGTGTYTVSPAVTFETGRTVTRHIIQNIGASTTDYATEADRFFQGYFLGGVVIGAGSTTIGDGTINSTTTLRLQTGGGDVVFGGGLTVTGAITGDASGLTNISSSSIDGATLTDLDAGNILTGTLSNSRLSSNVTLLGNTFNGADQLLLLNGSGGLPAVSGALVTGLDAGNISSGTLSDSRLSTNVTLLGNTFNGSNQLLRLNVSGGLPAVSGALVTGIDAGNISTGTISDSRLSTNVTVLGNTFNGSNQLLQLNVSGGLPAVSGALVTGLDASNIASGTIADGRLSSNVGLLSGSQTFTGLKTFSVGATITAGQTLTLNGDGLTDLTGSGLVLSGSSLAVDATTATAFIRNGSNSLGGLITIGSGDANDVSFVTTALDRLRIRANGNIGINNQTPDNTLNINTPATAVTATEVVISTDTASNKGLVIQGVASQTGNLLEAQTSTGSVIAGIDSTGRLLLGRASGSTGTIVMNNSTNANTTTLVSGVATGARTITLPDESGTVCLSSSNNCGYIRIAAGSVQTDASNNDVIAINKTSATGNLISIQRSGTAAFTVANSGALQIRATSTTGLDIQTGAGVSTFSVDTSGNLVRVGSATADATAVQLVLDTKNTTGDPTGVNGGQYYNSADGKFRCFENGAWQDCIEPINNAQLMSMFNTSATATNLALNTLNCVSDPSLRMMMNFTGQSRLRFVGRIGGTTNAATTIRLQYHLGGNPAVATGDAGWTTLATSAGGHTANTLFYTAESAIPAGAQTNNVLVRACLFSGNGAADPTITGVSINTYD